MVGSMKVQKKQRIERDDDKDKEDIRIKLLQHQIILLVSQKLCRESFRACLVYVFKNWKLLFKNICENTCGWKSVLKCVKCCLKTKNGCLKTQTKHPLILHNTLPNPTPIQELHIRWHKNCLPLHVDTWIHATFRHGVKEFDLSVNTHPNQPLELPRSSQASW